MTVTVCIPAFNAASFIGDAVATVYAQTWTDWRILISVDASGDETVALCRSLAAGPGVTVHAQPERLGWVGNYNFLLERVQTPFFTVLFHDDAWRPEHLSSLRRVLDDHPDVDFAYCATELTGARTGVVLGRDYLGPAESRVSDYLSGPFHAMPLRALCRTSLIERGYRIPDYGHDGFFAGRLGVISLLCRGAGRHLAEPLYQKRVRADSAVRDWETWDRARLRDAWAAHIAAAGRLLGGLDLGPEATERLFEGFLRQTFDLPGQWSPWPGKGS